MSSVARLEPLDRLSAHIPLVSFSRIDIRQPSLVRCLIDSAIAEQMLAYNVQNRRQRRAAVDYLKHQIKTGEWRDDHPQPVVFSDRGRLIDGQHRLQAIAELGISSPESMLIIRVETGARDDVREYMDTGVPRSLDDRCEIHSDPLINKVIAQLCSYEANFRGGGTHKKPSPEDARGFFVAHKESSVFVANAIKKERGTGRIQIAFAAMQYYEIDPSKAKEFYPALFIVDGPVQQARMLRDWCLRSNGSVAHASSGKKFRNMNYFKAVYCMKAHYEGKDVKRVQSAEW